MKLYKRGSTWGVEYYENGQRIRKALGRDIRTEAEAQTWLANFIHQESELALRNFIKAYLYESQVRISASTLEVYKNSLKNFESYFGVHRKINTITSREITAWAAFRKSQGLSPETVNLDLRHVKAALNRAVAWELIEKAPRIEMIKTPKRLPKHLTPEQFRAIIAHEQDERFRRLWTFMVWIGVRRAEVAGLRWEHISWGEKPQASIIGKGDRQRVIPLLPPAVAALGEPTQSGFVFPLGSLHYLSHRFRKVARAAKVKAHLHMLRHTACTWMVGQGVPIALVKDVAGHSDIKTTMGYAKTFVGATYDTLASVFGFQK